MNEAIFGFLNHYQRVLFLFFFGTSLYLLMQKFWGKILIDLLSPIYGLNSRNYIWQNHYLPKLLMQHLLTKRYYSYNKICFGKVLITHKNQINSLLGFEAQVFTHRWEPYQFFLVSYRHTSVCSVKSFFHLWNIFSLFHIWMKFYWC